MQFQLTFDMGNAAFERDSRTSEMTHILVDVAEKLCTGRTEGPVSDSNGNNIGNWSITGERLSDGVKIDFFAVLDRDGVDVSSQNWSDPEDAKRERDEFIGYDLDSEAEEAGQDVETYRQHRRINGGMPVYTVAGEDVNGDRHELDKLTEEDGEWFAA